MLILTPFSHIPCSNEIRQQNSRLSFFSKSVFQGAERENAKKGCFAVYSKIAPGVDLVGTIQKTNLLHLRGHRSHGKGRKALID